MVTSSPPVVEIRNMSRHVDQEVTVEGWLYNLRESGKILFPIFRDGTGLVQGVVVKSAVPPELFEKARELTQESSLRVTGKVRAEPRAPSVHHAQWSPTRESENRPLPRGGGEGITSLPGRKRQTPPQAGTRKTATGLGAGGRLASSRGRTGSGESSRGRAGSGF